MADAVTLSLLPVSLALVHIPRSRLPSLSHPILKHILHPTPTFFNLTANQIELSLFVDYLHVHDFESIAKTEVHHAPCGPLEISHEPWSVFQIDSHTDQLDNAGARVNELSAPLAAAGISILYQSSYMSDYIFVKQSRLHQALSLFEKSGFRLYTVNPPPSPSLSPVSPNPITGFSSGSSSPTILTRSQPSTFPSASSSNAARSSTPNIGERTKSHSPTGGEVRILHPDLACVGLSDELGADHWGLKIVKLVAFPELISSSDSMWKGNGVLFPGQNQEHASPQGCRLGSGSRLFEAAEDENDDDGYFSHSPPSLSPMSPPPTGHSSLSPVRKPRNSPPPLTPADVLKDTAEEPLPESLQIPFFSFTRTQEGSSLTADVNTLAALFPPEERHLLICCADLDLCLHLNSACECNSDEEGHDLWETHVDEEDDHCGSEDRISTGALKCLQIDLRRFGLDKHGLVNKFSKILEKNGVNHMYSSTFKTANLLVNKRHAIKAQALLRGC